MKSTRDKGLLGGSLHGTEKDKEEFDDLLGVRYGDSKINTTHEYGKEDDKS